MLSVSTVGAGSSNSASMAPRACSAVSGSAASTATMPSSFTTVTPGHGLRPGRVHPGQRRAMGRRAEDAGIEHARKADVTRVLGGPGHLLHAVHSQGGLAHDGEVPDGPKHGLFVHGMGDGLAPGEGSIGDAPRAIGRHVHDAVGDRKGDPWARRAAQRPGRSGPAAPWLRRPGRRDRTCGWSWSRRCPCPTGTCPCRP